MKGRKKWKCDEKLIMVIKVFVLRAWTIIKNVQKRRTTFEKFEIKINEKLKKRSARKMAI